MQRKADLKQWPKANVFPCASGKYKSTPCNWELSITNINAIGRHEIPAPGPWQPLHRNLVWSSHNFTFSSMLEKLSFIDLSSSLLGNVWKEPGTSLNGRWNFSLLRSSTAAEVSQILLKCDLEAANNLCQSFKNHLSSLLSKEKLHYQELKQMAIRQVGIGGQHKLSGLFCCDGDTRTVQWGTERLLQRRGINQVGHADHFLLPLPLEQLSLLPYPHSSTCTDADLDRVFFFM